MAIKMKSRSNSAFKYFLLLRNHLDEEELDFILSGLKTINEIQVAVEIDPLKLKSKENLIF